MKKLKSHNKIEELKKRDSPINYSSVSIDENGDLLKRASLLDDRVVEGYGVIWGVENSHGEVFVKGCFSKSIKENGPGSGSNFSLKFRDEHGKACSLFEELKEDEIGLYFRTVPLDDVPWCNDMLVQIRSKTINNFSIGFKHCWDKIEWDEENDAMLNLEAKLYEISAVSIPSDMETYAIRSEEEKESVIEDVEDFILSLQKTKQLEARKIFTRCMSLLNQEPLDKDCLSLRNKKPIDTSWNLDYLISKI